MPSIDELMLEMEQLRAENEMLKMLLKENGIALPVTASDADCSLNEETPTDTIITKRNPLPEKIALFLSLFQGRPDVYARRWESKNRRSGYSPACKNEWKSGMCLKPKGKCVDCSRAEYYIKIYQILRFFVQERPQLSNGYEGHFALSLYGGKTDDGK